MMLKWSDPATPSEKDGRHKLPAYPAGLRVKKAWPPPRRLADYSKFRLVADARRLAGVPPGDMQMLRQLDKQIELRIAQIGRTAFNDECAYVDDVLMDIARRWHRRPTDFAVYRAAARQLAGAPHAVLVLAATVRLLAPTASSA